MQVVKVVSTGDWGRTKRWLNKVRHVDFDAVLHKYGEIGVRELKLNTPKRSGLTAESWTYKIEKDLDSSGDGIIRIITQTVILPRIGLVWLLVCKKAMLLVLAAG